jgi:hypothetical protein
MTKPNPFRYFRTSPEIIRLAVMMYVRFLVEPFWPVVRRKPAQKSRTTSVFVKINGVTHYLWRVLMMALMPPSASCAEPSDWSRVRRASTGSTVWQKSGKTGLIP